MDNCVELSAVCTLGLHFDTHANFGRVCVLTEVKIHSACHPHVKQGYSLTGKKNIRLSNSNTTYAFPMCNFFLLPDGVSPSFFCLDPNCVDFGTFADDYVSISVATSANRDTCVWRAGITLEREHDAQMLSAALLLYGDICDPIPYYRGRHIPLEMSLEALRISNGEYVVYRTVWPYDAAVRFSMGEPSPSYVGYVTDDGALIPLHRWDAVPRRNRCLPPSSADWRLQSEEMPQETPASLYGEFVERLALLRRDHIPEGDEWMFHLFENLFQTAYWMRKCDSATDYVALSHMSYKLFTGKAITHQCSRFLVNKEDVLQADFGEFVLGCRNIFDLTSLAITSPIVKKIHDLYTYLLVQGFLSKFGLEISDKEFQVLAAKSGKSYDKPTSLLVHVVDTALTVCEKLIEYRNTGDLTGFVHSHSAYNTWVKEADRILELAPFTSNLGAHGTSYFSFISDLNNVIERGEAIRKHSIKNVGVESTLLGRKLQNLHMLKNIEVTRRASQKEREAPFGVLVHGASSVGKSTFTKMLYYYYGSLHQLEKDDHFRYVRNPADEYWSNFDSSKWCIQMDDIAFLLPSKSNEVDPTLKEMLNVVNNVPYVPPQAALEDKGKTPVLAKLVVATTNAKDLNAHEYFYCPLAVRRRLPYVVHVEPKPEFLHANKKFLNTSAIPDFSGSYPDFWVITVQKVVPVEASGRDWAKLEDVAKFDDVELFLEHFGRASFEHLDIQDRSHSCDAGMRDIGVCPICFKVAEKCGCLQAGVDLGIVAGIKRCAYEFACQWFMWTLSWSWVMWMVKQVARVRLARSFMGRCVNHLHVEAQVLMFSVWNGAPLPAGYQRALNLLSFWVPFVISYVVVGHILKPAKKEKTPPEESKAEFSTMKPQGNRMGTTENDLLQEESSNVWFNADLPLTSFDVPKASLSLASMTDAGVRDLFAANCVRISVTALDTAWKCRTGGVYVRGQMLIVNGHVFKSGDTFEISIQSTPRDGVSPNHTLRLKRSDISFFPERDIACFQVLSVPPYKDIVKYWNTGQIPVSRLLSVRRDSDGNVTERSVYGATYAENFPIEALGVSVPIYMGRCTEITKSGDCGALGVAITPKGPVVMGIHTLGYESMCGFPHITRSELEGYLDKAEKIKHAVGGGQPILSLQGDVALIPPHRKSIFRFMPDGTAKVYGSFPGFRPRPRSRVTRTPICRKVLDHFHTQVKFDKPCMSGWEPWQKNVQEMVCPTVNYDRETLATARNSFLEDILSDLPLGWEGELVILSRKATVNGLPGVKYIDRINCGSSMGHPWCTTKKKFLIDDKCEKYPHGVDFVPEVWEEADRVEALYAGGGRAFPIFTAHLKDEPTPIAKCVDKKTRLFTGASVPYSLVVRKYLLSFVRLLQKNKFAFEAGPGTVVQSIEWTDIYEYLTVFGEDRMIAGDYSKFDKRMIGDFILTAFDIIVELHARAGFSGAELDVLRGIASDTAFPLVNVNGDLVEFFGTNPSGHPLTVVINSLVNSLYMRYAFITLSKSVSGEKARFKECVHLFTYGDDNIMGVSPQAPWFNHTSIQQVLSTIGVGYTMADKESESREYIHISECSFLKRRWVYNEEVGAYLAPLDEDSIHKSLTTWIPSDTIDRFAQTKDVVSAANSEYFFYGREIFESHHDFFKELLAQEPFCHYVTETTLPDWDELRDRFWKSSRVSIPIA